MQPPGRRADQLLQAAFDVHVHVFERARELERPGFDLGQDLIEALGYLARVGFA